ncbi:cytochrome C [Achromatium sp. WMS2]|nr:cytochrome C [Achromatium sp. WMS2]
MKSLFILVACLFVPLATLANEGAHLEVSGANLRDTASLQRGAKYFMNYCFGCHSLKYARYNRMAKDLGLTDDMVKDNLMFVAGSKVGDNITIAMTEEQGTNWFGTVAPDLSLVSRSKIGGVDWIYTYLKSFYLDPTRPYGVNNILFDKVGMPDVLWELRGTQKAVFEDGQDTAGNPTKVFVGFKREGGLPDEQFDAVVRDLANFLAYTGEPMRLERGRIGNWVILFLVIFTILAYALKKEYWRDVDH